MTAAEGLWEVAVDQYGFVTQRDAASMGVSRAAVDSLVARGKLDRVAPGVYRFGRLPQSQRDPYMLAVLWTATTGACLSHDTALAVREVCDINPDRIHVTVPQGRRIRRRGGDLYVVHHEDLDEEQIGWWEQIPMVALPTAIRQCIASGVPTYLLLQALQRGLAVGALTSTEVDGLEARLRRRDDDL